MFYEHVFPYSINVATHPTSVSTSPIASDFFNFLLDPLPSHSQPAPESLNPLNNSNNPTHIPILSASQPVLPEAAPATRRSSRTRKAPEYLKDFHCQFTQSTGNGESSPLGHTLYLLS